MFTGHLGFFFAARGQRYVHPAGEAVFQVPLRLPMSQQNQFRHVRCRLLTIFVAPSIPTDAKKAAG